MIDLENKAGIPEADLRSMCNIPAIQWIGHQDDILPQLVKASIVVLPSYREGIPKTLIEACAVGRAIITTNVPGCKGGYPRTQWIDSREETSGRVGTGNRNAAA